MPRSRVCWGVLVLLCVGICACRTQTVTVEVEKPVTWVVTESVVVTKPVITTIEVTVEKTVIVTQQETVQVVVTFTPTPIPEGGFVTRTTFNDAQTLNPVLGADRGSQSICELMFEGLLRVDPFTGELRPNFAEGWTVSDDGLTYTFAIRRGLYWSDGQPITAHDFWFTYSALQSGKLDTPNVAKVSSIQKIEVLNEYAAAVTFAQADCSNLEKLQLNWLPMHVFTDDAAAFDFAELATHEFNTRPAVFSGPFVLKEWVRGDRWVQVRNDRYWRGAPHLEGIITQVVSGQAAMIKMLRSGEADVGSDFKPSYLVEVELEPALQIWKFLSDEYDFLAFQLGDPDDPQPRLNPDGTPNEEHGDHPILKDRLVRQAIDYALDRDELIVGARFGQAIPLHANVLPTISWAYNVDLEPHTHDLEQASRLLDRAGWAMNEATGVRRKNGQPLRLRLYTNAGNEVREMMGALIRDQLGEVGIEVELITVEWNAFLDVLFGQTFDMVLVSWSNLGVNPDDARFWSAQSDVPGRGSNFGSYYSPDVEAKLAQAKSVPRCDLDTRARLYRQIQAQLHEDQPYCWLDVPRRLIAINKRVGGVNPGPWGMWYNVHEWYIIS